MKKIFNTLCSLLAVLAIASCSVDDLGYETGAVHGFACAEDGTPLVGCQVEVMGTEMKTITDEEGLFSFYHVPAGTQKMVLTEANGITIEEDVQVDANNAIQVTLQKFYDDFPFGFDINKGFESNGEVTCTAYIKNYDNQEHTCRISGDEYLYIENIRIPDGEYYHKDISANTNFTLAPNETALITYSTKVEHADKFRKMYVTWNGKTQAVVFYTDWGAKNHQ